MAVNMDKTKIVNFRKKGITRSKHVFRYGKDIVEYKDVYKYLGIHFDEYANFEFNEDQLSKAGSRALGSVISKLKQNDNKTYESFTKCVKCCIHPVLDYGSEILGMYKATKSEKVETRTMRVFLGVHKFCPIASMYGDMGWVPGEMRRKVSVLRYWNKLINMKDDRLTKEAFEIDYSRHDKVGCWCYYVKNIFRELDMLHIFEEQQECNLSLCQEKLCLIYKEKLMLEIQKKPKLRLYSKVKQCLETERYVKLNMTANERSMLAQLRMGILPIKVETGRFVNLKINERICDVCPENKIEDELHFLFNCEAYSDARREFIKEVSLNKVNFETLCDLEKLDYCCKNVPRKLAKYIMKVFQIRKDILYTS